MEFPDCNVDLVLSEMRARGVQTPASFPFSDGGSRNTSVLDSIDQEELRKTPTEHSVEFCLQWLAGYVDRNTMKMTDSKWEKDYSADPITAISPGGSEYTTWPTVKTELEELGIEVISTYGLMQGCCHLVCEIDYQFFSEGILNRARKEVEKVFNKYAVFYGAEVVE